MVFIMIIDCDYNTGNDKINDENDDDDDDDDDINGNGVNLIWLCAPSDMSGRHKL